MLDYVTGKVKEVRDKTITIDISGFGVALLVPKPEAFVKDIDVTLYAHLHWNQEKGPALFGFEKELDRMVFLMLIGCSKIGPSIALTILSKFSAGQFLEIIAAQNEKQLSSINGIGAKKAEHIIVQLKHKVQKLLASGEIKAETQESFVQWQNVSDVLTSLNYSKQEVSKAMLYLTEKYSGQNYNLDTLIRSALTYLSSPRA